VRRNIKLVISYDGTEFSGWQIQSSDRSVQGVMTEALSDLHQEAVSITGAGRTDSGVHAVGQVGNFYTEKDTIPDWKFRDALNARLPRDIRILSSVEVPRDFHSRRDACFRQYEYRMIEGPVGPAHMARFTWLIRRMPSLVALNDMASAICGTHDFSTFAAAGDASGSRIRRIYHAAFLSDSSTTVFRISGNAFLWRMVRSLLGTMIDLGVRGMGRRDMQAVLDSKERKNAGPTAPSHGLFLKKVSYGPDTGVY
jgi:tRNA pseudouridine38-40 synthase